MGNLDKLKIGALLAATLTMTSCEESKQEVQQNVEDQIENTDKDNYEVNETEESIYNWKSIFPANTNLMPAHFIRNDSIFEQYDQNFKHKAFTGIATEADKQSFAKFREKDWKEVMGE